MQEWSKYIDELSMVKDKKLPNLKVPASGKKGVSKFMRRKAIASNHLLKKSAQEGKAYGPTGVSYYVPSGHKDEVNPKTKEKYPERQKPDYKAPKPVKEVSKNTLKSYIKKASNDLNTSAMTHGHSLATDDDDQVKMNRNNSKKRMAGIAKAADKMSEDNTANQQMQKDNKKAANKDGIVKRAVKGTVKRIGKYAKGAAKTTTAAAAIAAKKSVDNVTRTAAVNPDGVVNLFAGNITVREDDMKGMSVSSGHKRSTDSGAGMTAKGVAAYRRRNPGSKLKTAVTTPPSKLKKGSKAANRRKSFCARSRSWTGERGKAARRRWNC